MLLRRLRVLLSRSGVVSDSMTPLRQDLHLRGIGHRGEDRRGRCDGGGVLSGPLSVGILVEILLRNVV